MPPQVLTNVFVGLIPSSCHNNALNAVSGPYSCAQVLSVSIYLYFCTSKASKLSPNTPIFHASPSMSEGSQVLSVSICTFVLVKQVN